jgi:hypothetical protein
MRRFHLRLHAAVRLRSAPIISRIFALLSLLPSESDIIAKDRPRFAKDRPRFAGIRHNQDDRIKFCFTQENVDFFETLPPAAAFARASSG